MVYRKALLIGMASGFLAACQTTTSTHAVTGRSVCDGSLVSVEPVASGAAADRLEELQATYEGQPGFLAVVVTDSAPTIVVEAGRLAAWRSSLADTDVDVAPSCIQPDMLRALQIAAPQIAGEPGAIVSIGYDALDDAIRVRGATVDRVIEAVRPEDPDVAEAIPDAVTAGTLRIGP